MSTRTYGEDVGCRVFDLATLLDIMKLHKRCHTLYQSAAQPDKCAPNVFQNAKFDQSKSHQRTNAST